MNWIPNPYQRGDLVVVIDCGDLDRSARFWAAALGYLDEGRSTGPYRTLRPSDGPGVEVLLQRTADRKHGKNRVHLDLRTRDLDAEVARVAGLGATVLTGEPIVEDGWTWHVLGDPDGNEFCVILPPPSYWSDR
jgi:predicted enzyme related to lactoylglutathione lyase